KINNLLGWLTFIIATLTYVLTVEPTASFWDVGEFIAAAYKMQVVHQPGAPLFLMLQNLFSNFAMGNKDLIAYWIDRKSTRLNSSHVKISYAVFCLKKKKQLRNP